MLAYLTKRLLMLLPILLLLSVLVFFAMELIPGDPLLYLVDPATMSGTENLDALREHLGLNGSVFVRYGRWLGRMLTGDFGYSIFNGAPISHMLASRIPATLELSLAALLVSTLLGLGLGFVSAIKQNTVLDYFNTSVGMLGISVPDFFFGISAILIFGVRLGWLPTGGRLVYGATGFADRLAHLVMPSLVLGFAMTAALMRTTRASMLDVLGSDYIKTARSKGLSRARVYLKHALRNALMPMILMLCFRLPMLIGGSVVIESVFNWTGMGQMLLQGVGSKDYPVVMVTVLAVAMMMLLASVLVDILTALLDPRVRIER